MRILTLGSVLFSGAVALTLASTVSAQQQTMKLSSPTINDVAHEWMKAFKAGVESRAGGRIKVEIYPASQLGPIPRTVEGVALGTIELTLPAVGFLVGLDPRFEVLDAPGLFDDVTHAMAVLTDPDMRKRLSTFGSSKGIEPLVTFANGPLTVVSHKTIRGLADFKGQKIRVPGATPLYMEPYRKLGVSPLSMPLSEVLPAMQNRAIDGVIAGSVVFTSFKYYDIAKGMTYLPGSFLIASGIVNRNFMKSLGPELEAIVREEARKAESLFSTWGVEDVERIRKTWEQNGGQAITFAPAEAKRYLDDMSAAIAPIIGAKSQLKADYDALLVAAKRYRK